MPLDCVSFPLGWQWISCNFTQPNYDFSVTLCHPFLSRSHFHPLFHHLLGNQYRFQSSHFRSQLQKFVRHFSRIPWKFFASFPPRILIWNSRSFLRAFLSPLFYCSIQCQRFESIFQLLTSSSWVICSNLFQSRTVFPIFQSIIWYLKPVFQFKRILF